MDHATKTLLHKAKSATTETVEASKVLVTLPRGKKHGVPNNSNAQEGKRQRIDNSCTVLQYCTASLEKTVANQAEVKTSVVEVQISADKKALRTELLKKRFADTILRAQQQTLLNPGVKVDPVKKEMPKEKLSKEKTRTEDQIKAGEDALRLIKTQQRRRKEREAARAALDKVTKTVEFNDGLQIAIELEFEKLFGSSFRQQFFNCS